MSIIENKYHKYLSSWPFVEALKIVNRFGSFDKIKNLSKENILFQTGYGPSGLPHIGTFGEVVRTSMVRNALESLVKCKTKMITFSDDMDGLRKIPENIPNKELLKKFIGKPLTSVPDPFEKFESFGHHNNAKLKNFLDNFNFDYNFVSSTEQYKSGLFNKMLTEIMQNYEKIISIILPTLRKERRETYSPFLPISPFNGEVLQVKIEEYDKSNNSIIFTDPGNNKKTEINILNGNCKLQWKVDWAMRWMALEVDYEMCGKDLTESVEIASKICKVMQKKPPTNLIYEMFLDENGEKISKSIGNGISIEQWLRYANPESLSYYMFLKPRSAKKLFFDIIPKSVDDYYSHLRKYHTEENDKKYNNPVWHIHKGLPPNFDIEINFNSIINLVSISNSTDKNIIWDFVNSYDNNLKKDFNEDLDKLIQHSINYYNDFILPNKNYSKVDETQKSIFIDILNFLEKLRTDVLPEDIQKEIYEIGKKHNFENLRDFFRLIYRVLLGQDNGPRLGSFVKLYGIKNTCKLIEKIIKNGTLSK